MAVSNRVRDADVAARLGAGVPLKVACVSAWADASVPGPRHRQCNVWEPAQRDRHAQAVVRPNCGSPWPGTGGPVYGQSANARKHSTRRVITKYQRQGNGLPTK
jgi:hypothetical protein